MSRWINALFLLTLVQSAFPVDSWMEGWNATVWPAAGIDPRASDMIMLKAGHPFYFDSYDPIIESDSVTNCIAKHIWRMDCINALLEREWHVKGVYDYADRKYTWGMLRDDNTVLGDIKSATADLLDHASWANTNLEQAGSYDAWFQGSACGLVTTCCGVVSLYNYTQFPTINSSNILRILNLPTNFFVHTPTRGLHNANAGTSNDYGWDGLRRVLKEMQWVWGAVPVYSNFYKEGPTFDHETSIKIETELYVREVYSNASPPTTDCDLMERGDHWHSDGSSATNTTLYQSTTTSTVSGAICEGLPPSTIMSLSYSEAEQSTALEFVNVCKGPGGVALGYHWDEESQDRTTYSYSYASKRKDKFTMMASTVGDYDDNHVDMTLEYYGAFSNMPFCSLETTDSSECDFIKCGSGGNCFDCTGEVSTNSASLQNECWFKKEYSKTLRYYETDLAFEYEDTVVPVAEIKAISAQACSGDWTNETIWCGGDVDFCNTGSGAYSLSGYSMLGSAEGKYIAILTKFHFKYH